MEEIFIDERDMVQCDNCESDLESSWKYCSTCGYPNKQHPEFEPGTEEHRDNFCMECGSLLKTEKVVAQLLLPMKKDIDGIQYEDIKVFSNFELADHVRFYKFPYTHHAIIEGTNSETQTLSLIGWSLSPNEIVRSELKLELFGGTKISRAIYIKGCYNNAVVLHRARARLGEKEYHFFTNDAEAFPKWCKTGKGGGFHDDNKADERFCNAVSVVSYNEGYVEEFMRRLQQKEFGRWILEKLSKLLEKRENNQN